MLISLINNNRFYNQKINKIPMRNSISLKANIAPLGFDTVSFQGEKKNPIRDFSLDPDNYIEEDELLNYILEDRGKNYKQDKAFLEDANKKAKGPVTKEEIEFYSYLLDKFHAPDMDDIHPVILEKFVVLECMYDEVRNDHDDESGNLAVLNSEKNTSGNSTTTKTKGREHFDKIAQEALNMPKNQAIEECKKILLHPIVGSRLSGHLFVVMHDYFEDKQEDQEYFEAVKDIHNSVSDDVTKSSLFQDEVFTRHPDSVPFKIKFILNSGDPDLNFGVIESLLVPEDAFENYIDEEATDKQVDTLSKIFDFQLLQLRLQNKDAKKNNEIINDFVGREEEFDLENVVNMEEDSVVENSFELKPYDPENEDLDGDLTFDDGEDDVDYWLDNEQMYKFLEDSIKMFDDRLKNGSKRYRDIKTLLKSNIDLKNHALDPKKLSTHKPTIREMLKISEEPEFVCSAIDWLEAADRFDMINYLSTDAKNKTTQRYAFQILNNTKNDIYSQLKFFEKPAAEKNSRL